MRFSCEKCGRAYVADAKVEGRTFKMKCKQCGHVILVRGKPAAKVQPGEEVVGTFSVGVPVAGSEPVPPPQETAEPIPDLTADLAGVAEVHTPTPTPLGIADAPAPPADAISPSDPFGPHANGASRETPPFDPFAGHEPSGYIELKLDDDQKTPSVGLPVAPLPTPAAAEGGETLPLRPVKTPAPTPAAAEPASRKGSAGKILVAAAAALVASGGYVYFARSPGPTGAASAPAPSAAASRAAPAQPPPPATKLAPAPEPRPPALQPEQPKDLAAGDLPRKGSKPAPVPSGPPPPRPAKPVAAAENRPAKQVAAPERKLAPRAAAAPASQNPAPPRPAEPAAIPRPPPVPDTIGPRPDQAAVTRALARSQRAIDACVAATLAKDPTFDVPSTAVVIATVSPAGKIVYPTLDDAPLNVSELGSCIKGVVARTPVQRFEGDLVRVRVPVLLRR